MNAPATVAQIPVNAPKIGVGQVYLKGRISYQRIAKTDDGRLFITILKIAAVDEFSHPSTIEVTSREKLGDINDDWSGVCQVSGYPRSYDQKPDPETGEIKTIRTATISLRVVN